MGNICACSQVSCYLFDELEDAEELRTVPRKSLEVGDELVLFGIGQSVQLIEIVFIAEVDEFLSTSQQSLPSHIAAT